VAGCLAGRADASRLAARGQGGLGKIDFALAAARELVAEPGVPQPTGDHPDIIHLTYGPKDDKGEKAQAEGKPFDLARSIRIKQIRAMQKRLITRPDAGQPPRDHHRSGRRPREIRRQRAAEKP
jgi:hypothetical protein